MTARDARRMFAHDARLTADALAGARRLALAVLSLEPCRQCGDTAQPGRELCRPCEDRERAA